MTKNDIGQLNVDIDDSVNVEIDKYENVSKLMDNPFNPTLINIENKLLNIDLLIKRIKHSPAEIELNTDTYFQRKSDLWDDTQQSRLIESILVRFPLPAFYFDGTNKNKWLVVDGLQRLSSLRNFMVIKKLNLTNLEFLTHLNGKSFDDLDRDLQRLIEETQIVAYIINPGTPLDVKFNIFKRINTGGITLNSQEIRHALNQGVSADFVKELSTLPEFLKATGDCIKTDRMLDRDFITRFLAFYFFGYENFNSDLDTFMTSAMSHVSKIPEKLRVKCKEEFRESMIINYKIFEGHTFRKITKETNRKKPLNKALFEVLSVSLATISKDSRSLILKSKKSFKKELMNLLDNDSEFYYSVSQYTGDKKNVITRFTAIHNLVNRLGNVK